MSRGMTTTGAEPPIVQQDYWRLREKYILALVRWESLTSTMIARAWRPPQAHAQRPRPAHWRNRFVMFGYPPVGARAVLQYSFAYGDPRR
jgi:hypothetical protein